MTHISLPRHQRTVTFGDHVSYSEAAELVILQGGTCPIYPVPVGHGADTFRLDHATPGNVLESILLGDPLRIVDAAQAWDASQDIWDHVTVPLKDDRYLLVPLSHATLKQITAHHARWETACLKS